MTVDVFSSSWYMLTVLELIKTYLWCVIIDDAAAIATYVFWTSATQLQNDDELQSMSYG